MRDRNARSAEASAYRWLYKTASWQALRTQTFVRDLYICQMCGLPAPPTIGHPHSAVCDHIKDHKGNVDLFYDPDNVRTLGKSCHDRHAQREAHGTARPYIGPDGWPV